MTSLNLTIQKDGSVTIAGNDGSNPVCLPKDGSWDKIENGRHRFRVTGDREHTISEALKFLERNRDNLNKEENWAEFVTSFFDMPVYGG